MGYACFLIVFCRILRAYSAIPRPARVWPSPPSPIRCGRLALAHAGRAAQRIDVPELDSGAEILHTDFPGHFGSRFAAPNDAELRFRSLVKNIDHVAGLQLRVHALQRCAAAADGAQAGGLSERARIRVHAPDLNRKIHENTRLAAPIHAFSFGGKMLHGRRHGPANKGNRGHKCGCVESLVTAVGSRTKPVQSASRSEQAPGPRGSPQDPQAPDAAEGPDELLADIAKTLS